MKKKLQTIEATKANCVQIGYYILKNCVQCNKTEAGKKFKGHRKKLESYT